MLGELGVAAAPSQIVLTEGASRAFELVIRRLLAPGDTALVDDPGYYNLFGNLRLSNVRLIGIPRLPDGPDLERLEVAASEHRPKVYFTQSALQNPTSTSMSLQSSHRVLALSERYGFHVVEDDVFCDLQEKRNPRLAALDGLQRVIYVRSFSKTVSGSVRVGFLAASSELAAEFADVKMLTAITSSQLTERVVHLLLTEGHYRKHIAQVRARLNDARVRTLAAFERLRLEVFGQPQEGMFVWARFPHVDDSRTVVAAAERERLLLAPGYVFRPHLERSAYLRFNVTACNDARVLEWLERTASAEPLTLTSPGAER